MKINVCLNNQLDKKYVFNHFHKLSGKIFEKINLSKY